MGSEGSFIGSKWCAFATGDFDPGASMRISPRCFRRLLRQLLPTKYGTEVHLTKQTTIFIFLITMHQLGMFPLRI